MKFDIDRLKEESGEDYEEAWRRSGKLIEKSGKLFSLEDKGLSHPLFDLVQELRKVLIELGFREIVVPTLIKKDEIHKQYGPQAPIILDRIFFLAGVDRSDLGISRGDLEKIREEIPDFEKLDELEGVFRRYKEGEIPSDDLTEVIMEELDLTEDQASYVLSLFKNFRELKPVPSEITLRSHTTAGWFSVLKEMQFRESLPVQLFTVGPKFRREQRLDKTHLYHSWTASLVVMAEEISLEDGEDIAQKVLRELGFEKIDCRKKDATSKYYAPQSEFEIYVEHPKTGEMIEVGDAGLYSPVSLAKYEISHPVFNLGIGLERVVMIRTGEEDIRSLVYPYLYEELELSDEQISRMLNFEKEPVTEVGREIAERIEQVARGRKDEPSPCEFELAEENIEGVKVVVKLIEPEEGKELIGPAAFNQVYVADGNIIGVPQEGLEGNKFLQEAREEGAFTGISYIEGFSKLAARKIEEAVEKGREEVKIRVPIVESLSDINLKLEKPAHRYITDNNKKIDVRGPVFATVIAKIG